MKNYFLLVLFFLSSVSFFNANATKIIRANWTGVSMNGCYDDIPGQEQFGITIVVDNLNWSEALFFRLRVQSIFSSTVTTYKDEIIGISANSFVQHPTTSGVYIYNENFTYYNSFSAGNAKFKYIFELVEADGSSYPNQMDSSGLFRDPNNPSVKIDPNDEDDSNDEISTISMSIMDYCLEDEGPLPDGPTGPGLPPILRLGDNSTINTIQETVADGTETNDVDLNDQSLGIALTQDIKIYPNPCQDYFNLNFKSNGEDKIERIQIIDVSGQQVYYSNNFDNFDKSYKHEIDVSSLTTGIYLCQIQTSTESKVIKLLKQ